MIACTYRQIFRALAFGLSIIFLSMIVPTQASAAITGFWPGAPSTPGSMVFVFGSNFVPNATRVAVNGIDHPTVQVFDATFLAFLSSSAIGPITVTTAAGSATSGSSLGIPPTTGLQLTGTWRGQVKVGSFVFVFGSGFDPALGKTKVSINGLPCPLVHVMDSTLLLFIVPTGSVSGPVTVEVNSQTVTSNTPLTIVPVSKVFALMDVNDSTAVLDSFAARTTVDGLAFRTSWRVLEPQNGVYDWRTLDAAFDTVRTRGKQLTLHVGVASLGIPNWLTGLGVATYTYTPPLGAAVTEPIPWDAIFLSRYSQFVAALAAHVQARGDTGLLYAVSDGAPVAEMSLVGCQNNTLSGNIPYNRTNYLNAWKTTLDAHATAFAQTRLFISAPVAVICRPDNDGKLFYTDVMNHALAKSTKSTVFAADLNALGSARLTQVDVSISSRAAIAFQMIWSSPDSTQNRMQGTLKDAVCKGIGSGGRYFEIYKVDISSSDATIQDAIQRARAGQPC